MGNELTRSVLVVEDDQIDTEYILKALENFDIPVELAARSYEAIALLQRKDAAPPSLILLDWRISGGGASVLRTVRENPSLASMPVVILSRSTARDDVQSAYLGHANLFVAKAAELRDFQDQVASICDVFLNIARLPPVPDTDSYVSSQPGGTPAQKERGPVNTIVIVDDDQLTREHLREQLDRGGEFECVGTAYDPDTARELVEVEQPSLIVLDLMLGGASDPIELAAELVSLSLRSRIVICTAWSDRPGLDDEQVFRQKSRASRSGVIDWVSKGNGIHEVMARVREAMQWAAHPAGLSPLAQALGEYLRSAGSAFDEFPFRSDATELTPAEARIAAAVARGLEADMTVEDVARAIGLMPGTVRSHLKSIYGKWQVHGQAGFVAEARRRGLLSS